MIPSGNAPTFNLIPSTDTTTTQTEPIVQTGQVVATGSSFSLIPTYVTPTGQKVPAPTGQTEPTGQKL